MELYDKLSDFVADLRTKEGHTLEDITDALALLLDALEEEESDEKDTSE